MKILMFVISKVSGRLAPYFSFFRIPCRKLTQPPFFKKYNPRLPNQHCSNKTDIWNVKQSWATFPRNKTRRVRNKGEPIPEQKNNISKGFRKYLCKPGLRYVCFSQVRKLCILSTNMFVHVWSIIHCIQNISLSKKAAQYPAKKYSTGKNITTF